MEGPWLKVQEMVDAAALEAVREEACLLLEILGFVEVVVSPEEVKGMFQETALETHMAEALLAAHRISISDLEDFGEEVPALLEALRNATAEGSLWAPLWLGDLCLLCPEAWEGDDEANQQVAWYEQAAERGHPEAYSRLFPSEELVNPMVPTELLERDAKAGANMLKELMAPTSFTIIEGRSPGTSQVLQIEKEDDDEAEEEEEQEEDEEVDVGGNVEPPPRLRRMIEMLRASADAGDVHEQKEIMAMFRRPPKSRL